MDKLTNREERVLDLIVAGCSTKEIAARLGIAFKTASCHRAHIMSKVGASNAADLVRRTLTPPPTAIPDLRELSRRAQASRQENQEILCRLRAESEKAKELRIEYGEIRAMLNRHFEALAESLDGLLRARRLADCGSNTANLRLPNAA